MNFNIKNMQSSVFILFSYTFLLVILFCLPSELNKKVNYKNKYYYQSLCLNHTTSTSGLDLGLTLSYLVM